MNPNRSQNNENFNENEQKNTNENLIDSKGINPEKYKELELEPNSKKNINSLQDSKNPSNQKNSNTKAVVSSPDPVQQVKAMLSAGDVPSLQLIQNASYFLKSNKTDDANLWFAVLFQKLIREIKD